MKDTHLHRVVNTVFLAIAVTVVSGCSLDLPHLRVVRGNYNVSRGEYQRSIVDYLRARGDGAYEPWIAYNLGNVYHYLGEAEAAIDRWNVAEESGVPDLQFGAAFNRGVYFLEQGRYSEALEQFRFALIIDPSNIDAKRNFEIAIERLEAREGIDRDVEGEQSSPSTTAATDQPESTATRMLDYIRRKEEQQWRANAEYQPEPEERDW